MAVLITAATTHQPKRVAGASLRNSELTSSVKGRLSNGVGVRLVTTIASARSRTKWPVASSDCCTRPSDNRHPPGRAPEAGTSELSSAVLGRHLTWWFAEPVGRGILG